MNIFPFENTEFISTLNENEVRDIIENNIVWKDELGITYTRNTNKDYEGSVYKNSFKIRRILKTGINSFIPIVSGEISKKQNGTHIKLKLRLHNIIYSLSIIMTLFIAISILTSLFSSSSLNEYNNQLQEQLDEKLIKETLSEKDYNNLDRIVNSKKIDWIDLLLLFAPYLMSTVVFNYEAKVVKDKLKLILKEE